MDINHSDLISSSLYEFKSESELVSSIEEISKNFVFDRNKIANYREDKRLVSAYYQFFFPTNVLKLEEFFKRIDSSIVSEIIKTDFIDFGCGPGTFGSGLLNLFPDFSNKVFEVDLSNTMLEQAKKSHEYFFKDKNFIYLNDYKKIDSTNLTLFFGNSANEMEEDLIKEVITKLNPNFIIFMEPGTKDSFSKVIAMRHYLLARKFNSIYPCNSNKKCPLQFDEQDWCHQYFKVSYDPSIERITQKAKKDRRSLPVVSHLYAKDIEPVAKAIIIRAYGESKFGKEFEVCTEDNTINRVQVLFRAMDKSQMKDLSNLLAGEEIKYEIIKKIEKNFFRVKLI